jgi:nitrogen regulatory protein P-II 1
LKQFVVKKCLEGMGYFGMTITEFGGRGRQKGVPLNLGSRQYVVEFLPKLEIEVVVMDEDLPFVVNAIIGGSKNQRHR